MPAPLLERFRRLAALHNAMACAHAEGRPGIPSDELLDELGCARVALYRLAEDLRSFGAPLEYSESEHLWSYRHTWDLPFPVVTTLQGSVAVRMALDFLLDPQLEKDLQGSLAIDPQLRRSSTATLPRMTGIFSSALLGKLARALKERRRVRFQYRKPGEEQAQPREVEPLELFEWDGMPYLQARDPRSPVAFKRYALSRIDDLEVLERTFRPPARKQIPSCLGAFVREVFTARILADASHAPYVRERRLHPDQKIVERQGGAVEFVLPFGDLGEAARWILGKGPGFRPLSPAPLVGEWRRLVAELANAARSR